MRRPPRVRREKPRASFLNADVPKILALEPDLVLVFSDIQADIAAALIHASVAVHAFNQRTIRRHPGDDPHARRTGRRE